MEIKPSVQAVFILFLVSGNNLSVDGCVRLDVTESRTVSGDRSIV